MHACSHALACHTLDNSNIYIGCEDRGHAPFLFDQYIKGGGDTLI